MKPSRSRLIAIGAAVACAAGAVALSPAISEVQSPSEEDRESNADRVIIAGERVNILKKKSEKWKEGAETQWDWWVTDSTPARVYGECGKDWKQYFDGGATEAKLSRDGKSVVVASSAGGVAVIPYNPEGPARPKTAASFVACPDGSPHSAEMLPDGNVAVATASGIFLYSATRPADGKNGWGDGDYVDWVELPAAHGLHLGRRAKEALGVGQHEGSG